MGGARHGVVMPSPPMHSKSARPSTMPTSTLVLGGLSRTRIRGATGRGGPGSAPGSDGVLSDLMEAVAPVAHCRESTPAPVRW
jgi:hypothetical protein